MSERCDECDPSFTSCFSSPDRCVKRPHRSMSERIDLAELDNDCRTARLSLFETYVIGGLIDRIRELEVAIREIVDDVPRRERWMHLYDLLKKGAVRRG